ncbi:multidrug resistance-associated ABC transporter [Athelia psychrophila]|uniref:Multidrug resistance-associated ABC transporter n=1 Tax=Athelia psychrophila TaxID=1759441 RepID=A0A165YE86_9AGAM|nr:multidrug resistance-associated ABC transporter [Fibularhizoctonia sp. CBS 109695]
MWNPFHPPPAPPAFGANTTVPQRTAGPLSQLVFHWLGPFLEVGFSRPLEKDDLWHLPADRQTAALSAEVEGNFYARCPPEKRPALHRAQTEPQAQAPPDPESEDGASSGDHTNINADVEANEKEHEKEGEGEGESEGQDGQPHPEDVATDADGKTKYDSSLMHALHRTFFVDWWTSGILLLGANTLQTTSPLITKVLLSWLTDCYYYHQYASLSPAAQAQAVAAAASSGAAGESILTKPRGIGYGIGLAFALFAMQEVSSLMSNHYYIKAMSTGLAVRTAVIGTITRKSLRLSGRARLSHSNGQITTMISTDSARLDRFGQFAHNVWVGPIQIIIGIALLIDNLGPSALVGLAVLIAGFPIQFVLVRTMFLQRFKGVKITDDRIRTTGEVLQGIRLVKSFAWEGFFTSEVNELRTREIKTIKKVAVARSGLIAFVTLTPVLAAVLSFITYALTGHDLNVAIIFSSLQYFNIIRMPLIFFPLVLASMSDAIVALRRVGSFLTAEELPDAYTLDPDAQGKVGVEVDGDFVWETAGGPPVEAPVAKGKGKGGKPDAAKDKGKKGKKGKGKDEPVLPVAITDGEKGEDVVEKEKEEEKPFELKNLKMKVPKGAFVAIVGRVGSGKSSVLQGLIGEMRSTRGEVIFGGAVAYVPQTAWIRNSTLRENILFGQPDDEKRFRDVIRACSLEHDLEMLPNGEHTEIGEKGINLSGGQKARVSLARAAYSRSDVVLMDDSLSAVDAYVGKAILDNCITNGPLADRTRILVTHALHVLDKTTDYIYVMDDGAIKEQGTYAELMNNSVVFSRLMEEYGNLEQEKETGPKAAKEVASETAVDPKKAETDLMTTEERETGAVSWSVYTKYLRFAGGLFWAPLILLLLTLSQVAQVGNTLFLGYWTAQSIPGFVQADYMAVYASLGLASAVFAFLLSFAFAYASLSASLSLFKAALAAVLRSPIAFFDTTPIGRILSRLSKDQDTLDTEISMTLYQFLSTFSSVLGTVGLVFYTFPYLGIVFVPLTFIYWIVANYYRRTSVETKRLDSLMRSTLYGSLSETLTGLATIRAYKSQDESIRKADHGLDLENRAYYMTIAIQRWLSVRLDFCGNILILGIVLFAAGFRNTVSPSKIGVVLSYTLSITQTFSTMVTQYAQNEQNFNSVERVLVYTELPPDGEVTTPNDPPPSWPETGAIKFNDVKLAYREGLPLVLKGTTFEVRPGEKVGIVGRTGAGKSSLIQGLFRMVELQSGTIEIDGRNIRDMGLDVLRHRLALVPQDSVLFLGSLRNNLDPQGTRTDSELISALQRAWLLPRDGSVDPAAEAKFSLDSKVGDEGSNYSAGEKQLLALCRALVKNSRIIVLDEATSSVDVETDAKLQKTIQTEFASSTLLCIAHRLNTVAYYDRVLVMDRGEVAEFDTVLNLFDNQHSIFRSLCDEAGLSRQDILRIRQESESETLDLPGAAATTMA